MAGPPSANGIAGQNADFTLVSHSTRVRSMSDLRTQRTGNSSQLGTRRFDVLHLRKPFRQFSQAPYVSATTVPNSTNAKRIRRPCSLDEALQSCQSFLGTVGSMFKNPT
jgi:hypothetical protein